MEDLDFGYAKAAPCVFLKFQKKIEWMPQYFEAGNLSKANLSREVAQDIEENYEQHKPQVLVSDERLTSRARCIFN